MSKNRKNQSPISSESEQEELSLEELYKKLTQYNNNLYKIETLISVEQDEIKKDEYRKLRNSLLQAINYQEEAIKLAEDDGVETYSKDRLKPEYAERVCKGWYEKDKRWYHARIDSVDTDKLTCNVSWIGYNLTGVLHAIHVKLLPIPNTGKLKQGNLCEAINPSDGKWQGAFIEKISELGYHIKFRKSNNKEVVPIYFLRESRSHPSLNSTSLRVDNAPVPLELNIPDHLKILPNDSAEERLSKRKRIKHLKKRHKNGVVERELKTKKGKWQLFNERSKLKAKGHFIVKKNSSSMFRTSLNDKVGVIGTGRTMTKNVEKEKYRFEPGGWRDSILKKLKR